MSIRYAHTRLVPLLAVLALLAGLLAAAPARAASGTVSPQQGGVGTRFTFRADGFTPGERVDSWVTGPDGSAAPRYPSVYADTLGGIVWSWDVAPGTPSGPWNMTARGIKSDVRVVIGFEVVDSAPLDLGDVAPASGAPGTAFSFSARGFLPGERVSAWLTQPDGMSRDFDPGKEFRIYADEGGAVSWIWDSPAGLAPGTWVASARGFDSSRQVDIRFAITGTAPAGPARAITPTAGAPGTTFTVVVGGFNRTEVAGSWLTRPDGSSISATPYLVSDGEGVISWSWTAPADAPSGAWQAVTKGKDSGIQVTLPFTITGANPAPADPTAPTISLSPASVQPGGALTISVTGFEAGEDLYYWPTKPDGLPVENRISATADGQGAATWTYNVPNNAVAGAWTLSVLGDSSGRSAQAPFTVVMADPAAGTSVSPASGGPGTTFTFTASGFRDKPEKIYFWFTDPSGKGVNGPDWKRSSDDGTVTWEWTAPGDAVAGQWQAVAHGEKSDIFRVIPFTIVRDTPPVTAGASVSPESGGPGTTFTFTASGFKDREQVGYWLNLPDGTVIRFDHELVGDPNGEVTWTWTAPADAQRGLYVMAVRTSQSEKNKHIDHVVSYEIRFSVQ
ncbi:hypothetical protein K2Z83_22095 [Oscillochloris sp. ZM17-4]|uniref:hypothetical protein n=1 Tax=Oscillochloris sp. ZM17-4 TaxID=2866714 RepID=UPI001C73BB55|nr:hypothetical protein [Oscillochloris sp. ZM17-4]MBX0330358.1 hypothetical protein [Oscillochloris sp. ZM17-4]